MKEKKTQRRRFLISTKLCVFFFVLGFGGFCLNWKRCRLV